MTPASAAAAALAAAAVLALPAAARAERHPVATFAGGLTILGPLDGGPEDTALDLRATMSFEHPPPPYLEPRGYVFRGTIVPEIFAGRLSAGEDSTVNVGGGARFELAYSQSRMGLLQVSMRGGIYIAARGGLFTDSDHTPFFEGTFGEYFLLGSSARLGLEAGFMSIRTTDEANDPPLVEGAVFGPPFHNGEGSYFALKANLYLGVTL